MRVEERREKVEEGGCKRTDEEGGRRLSERVEERV